MRVRVPEWRESEGSAGRGEESMVMLPGEVSWVGWEREGLRAHTLFYVGVEEVGVEDVGEGHVDFCVGGCAVGEELGLDEGVNFFGEDKVQLVFVRSILSVASAVYLVVIVCVPCARKAAH